MSYNKIKNITFNKDVTKFKVNYSCSNDTSWYSTSKFINIEELFFCFDSWDFQVQIKEEKSCLVDNLVFGKYNIYKNRKYGYYEIFNLIKYNNFKKEKEFIEKYNIKNIDEIKKEFEKLNKDFLIELKSELKNINKKELYHIKYNWNYIVKFQRWYTGFSYSRCNSYWIKKTKQIACFIKNDSRHDLEIEKV